MRSKFDIYVFMYIQETIFTSVFNTENVMKPGFLCIPVSIALRSIYMKKNKVPGHHIYVCEKYT